MINDSKIMNEIIEKIKGLSKEQIEKALEETNKFFEENPELLDYKIVFRKE